MVEGYKRGLFQQCPKEEILSDGEGGLVLNGAEDAAAVYLYLGLSFFGVLSCF